MRILLLASSPLMNGSHSSTARGMALAFRDMGHEVFFYATSGIIGNGLEWKGMKILPPLSLNPNDPELLSIYYKKYNCDIYIHKHELVPFAGIPEVLPTVAYTPIESNPMPEMLENALKKCKTIVPYCKWAEETLHTAGMKCWKPIEEGFDLSVFKPINKSAAKRNAGFSQEEFIIGMVAANNDQNLRKRFDKNFEAIKLFMDANPTVKVKLYLHTDVAPPGAPDLRKMLNAFKLSNITILPDQIEYKTSNIDSFHMATLYSAMDVLLNISSSEGFGLPSIEAAACGTPVIQTNHGPMIDNTYKDMRVNVIDTIYGGYGGNMVIPDAQHAADILGKLYNTQLNEAVIKWGLEHAAKFDWNIIKEKWRDFLENNDNWPKPIS